MEKCDLVIKNGMVFIDGNLQQIDIGIRAGKTIALKNDLPKGKECIDATGKLVFPGFIDAHTHMGVPIIDTCSADDFASGSRAAACGGITTIVDFTVQERGQSLRDALKTRMAKASNCCVDYGIHVNITDNPEKYLHDIPQLIAEGFVSFKVFSTYRKVGMMVNWQQFRSILQCVHRNGGLLMLHAEDNDLVESCTDTQVKDGNKAPIFHTHSRTAAAEAQAIATACAIAGEEGASLYIVHVSSKLGLKAGIRAREQGVKVYLETCPQYLLLTDSVYHRQDAHRFITTPPLRGDEDTQALWEGVINGTIDVVATDHCPFTIAQKDSGEGVFYRTPNGLSGVETLFPLLYSYGVGKGRISLARLVDLLAVNPSRIFGYSHRKGTINIGYDADLVIWDPEAKTQVCARNLHGNDDWSPYEGMAIQGKLDYTILRGQILANNGICTEQTCGELITGKVTPFCRST